MDSYNKSARDASFGVKVILFLMMAFALVAAATVLSVTTPTSTDQSQVSLATTSPRSVQQEASGITTLQNVALAGMLGLFVLLVVAKRSHDRDFELQQTSDETSRVEGTRSFDEDDRL